MNTEELKRLAEAANDLDPGEWTAGNNHWVGCVLTKATLLGRDISLCVADCTTLEAAAMQNAAYIAAANPAAVLELIAEVDRLREDADDLTIALESSEKAIKDSRANDYTAMGYLADCRIAVGDNGKRMLPEFVEYLRQLKQQRDELLAALKDAREMVDDWGAYATAYMQERHDLAGDLERLDAAISKAEG